MNCVAICTNAVNRGDYNEYCRCESGYFDNGLKTSKFSPKLFFFFYIIISKTAIEILLFKLFLYKLEILNE